MRFVIQRVLSANVKILTDGEKSIQKAPEVHGIGKGYAVLIGISASDSMELAEKMVSKMLKLRIFEDDAGKTNLDLQAVGGELLLVSQFTLYADCSHGNRPGFTNAARPDTAIPIYEHIIQLCRESGFPVQTGCFGADMQVSLVNDGPFTVILDSDEIFK
ncbi:MAG: D-tyrosyl-tRNA(Tyr) deacylase [Lachnospiraceae bacterium]|nr:D-tyrosyl-tRNA(Tyr) deacylase [Lachnospiraceae bacterium]